MLEVFQEHNDKVEAIDFSRPTLIKSNTTLKHVTSFLNCKYKLSEIEVSRVDNHFITEFNFYLRTRCGCANNSAVKHLKNLGKVMRLFVANRWISFDPFAGHKNKVTKVERAILTVVELSTLATKVFPIERLQEQRRKLDSQGSLISNEHYPLFVITTTKSGEEPLLAKYPISQ